MPLPLPWRVSSTPSASTKSHALRLLFDARRAYRGGPTEIAARQRDRLADLVAFARARPTARSCMPACRNASMTRHCCR